MTKRDADASKAAKADLWSRGFEPVTRTDWMLVGIAILDVLMLLARDVYSGFLPPVADRAIVGIDIAIVVLFAIDFIGEGRHASDKLRYARNHWYELIGLVPVAHWGFRAFRLVRLLRIYVVTHFPPELYHDRSWHHALVRGVINHYKGVLLEEITDPIVLASIDAIEGPLVRAQFAGTIGNTLRDRRGHIHTVVDETATTTKGLGPLLSTRAGRRLLTQVTDEVLDQVILTLESEELNEVISDSIRDILGELRQRVREKEYRVAGGTVLRPSTGTARTGLPGDHIGG